MINHKYENFKNSYKKLMDLYTSNKKDFNQLFISVSKNYNIPYDNVRDSYLRAIFSVLVEEKKALIKKKKNIFISAFFYYMVMCIVFISTFLKKHKHTVNTDILFDGTDIGWYFNHYRYLDEKKPSHFSSKLFIGANSYKRYKSYIEPDVKSINKIEVVNRWNSWYFFEKEIARQVLKYEVFSFLRYHKLSKTLEIDFVNISLRVLRSILVSYSESKNISAKYLITFGDHYFNGIRYHYFKQNGIQNIVAIQNGLRLGISTDSMYINCDYYYGFDKNVFNYLEGLNCQYKLFSGSIKAAIFLEQLNKYKEMIDFDIALINHPMESSEHSWETREMYMNTVRYLLRYKQENPNIKIAFLLKTHQKSFDNEYFNEIRSLMKQAEATFQYSAGLDSYKAILTSKVIINMYSTLEKEAYSFRKRVFNINCNNVHEPIFKFKMNDDIGTMVNCNYDNFSNKLNRLLDLNNLEVDEFYKSKFEENKIFYENPIKMFFDSLENKKI